MHARRGGHEPGCDLTRSRLHPVFCVQIAGLDLARQLSAEQIDFIEQTMAKDAVVVIRGQRPDDDHHLRFSRLFGPLELPPQGLIKVFEPLGRTRGQQPQRRLRPELYDAGNLDETGAISAADSPLRIAGKRNSLWHTDSSFKSVPTKWSLLFAHIVPPSGGNTEFLDMRAVYEALPAAMKSRLEGLEAEHDLWHSSMLAGLGAPTEEQRRASPPALKPLVRTAADGRKVLLAGSHAARIVGWPLEDGRKLLQELNEFAAAQRQLVYSHRWQVGDLVVWDNRCTMHRGMPYESFVHKRDLRRTTIMEYGPESA